MDPIVDLQAFLASSRKRTIHETTVRPCAGLGATTSMHLARYVRTSRLRRKAAVNRRWLGGALSDGSRGLADIHFAGGLNMVVGEQGEAPAGMPRNATNYDGPIDFVGTVNEIAQVIWRIVGSYPVPASRQNSADGLPV